MTRAEDVANKSPIQGVTVTRRGLGLLPAAAAAGLAGDAWAQGPRQPGPTPEERDGILDLFARYAWYFDCNDTEGVVETFAPDGVIEAQGAEVARGRQAIRAFIDKVNGPRAGIVRQHCQDHPRFVREGEAWVVYSYWNQIETDPATSRSEVANLGYYVSRCVRTPGGWVFSKRSINRWNPERVPWARPRSR